MKHKFTHVFVLAVLTGFLLYKGLITAAIIVGLISLYKTLSWIKDPVRPLFKQMNLDAKAHGCRIANNFRIQTPLIRIYARYRRDCALYPAMNENFSEIIGGMWQELSKETTMSGWLSVLKKVDKAWPMTDSSNPLDESLEKGRQNAKRWREAQREVFG